MVKVGAGAALSSCCVLIVSLPFIASKHETAPVFFLFLIGTRASCSSFLFDVLGHPEQAFADMERAIADGAMWSAMALAFGMLRNDLSFFVEAFGDWVK